MRLFFYYQNLFKLAKKGKKKKSDILEIKYLSLTANIQEDLLMNKKMLLFFAIINALIISIVFLIVMIIKVSIIIKFLIGLLLLIGLIYSIYGIIGKIFIMKGFEKNEHKRN